MEVLKILSDYYGNYDEDRRLTSRHGSVEFLTTMRYIEKYLQPGMRILEIGAATGRYSHTLARQGYRVDAVELVAHNIERFRQNTKPGENVTITQGNAKDLGAFSEESFILMTESNDSYHRSMEMSRRAGFMPKRVSMAAAQMLTAYQLAERGYGVTFVSDQFIMHSTPTERLVFYKLADPSAVRPMYLYFRRNAPLTPVAQSFLDFVLETASISIKL